MASGHTSENPFRVTHIAKMTAAAGMERHLLALLPGLAARDIKVRLIILVEPDKPMTDYRQQMQAAGVPTEVVAIRHDFDWLVVKTLAAKIRQTDAIHTHLIHADLHGVIAAQRAGVSRVYCSAHNDDKFRSLWPVRLLQGGLWRRFTAGIAISEALRQFVIRTEFAPPDKVHTVHYGYDPAELPPRSSARKALCAALKLPAESLIIGSVCRLVEQKGLTYAIAAYAQIAAQFPNAHYVIVGDGPLRDRLWRQIRDLGYHDRIHLMGWRDNVRILYPAFDTFLMPSLWEGFGLVALEAMAAGVPVVASNISALPEIVEDGQTGFLVPPRDPQSLAAALTRLLNDTTLRTQMGNAGRMRLERTFNASRMVEGTLAVYAQR